MFSCESLLPLLKLPYLTLPIYSRSIFSLSSISCCLLSIFSASSLYLRLLSIILHSSSFPCSVSRSLLQFLFKPIPSYLPYLLTPSYPPLFPPLIHSLSFISLTIWLCSRLRRVLMRILCTRKGVRNMDPGSPGLKSLTLGVKVNG